MVAPVVVVVVSIEKTDSLGFLVSDSFSYVFVCFSVGFASFSYVSGNFFLCFFACVSALVVVVVVSLHPYENPCMKPYIFIHFSEKHTECAFLGSGCLPYVFVCFSLVFAGFGKFVGFGGF